MSDENILNLDELFGTSRPIKVNYQGNVYELVRPEAFNPVQYQQFSKMQAKYGKLQNLEKNLEDPSKLDDAMDGLIKLMCPELLKLGLPFAFKAKILEFYWNECLKDQYQNGEPPKNPIGA